MQHILKNKNCALFLDMGTGKTISTLTALDHLLNKSLDVDKPLIIAPKLVANVTWQDEIAKWAHTRKLKLVKILGNKKERLAALKRKGDLYITNRENVPWLVAHYGLGFPFDMVVIDELSSFKNKDSVRFNALSSVKPRIKRMVGLTGTPAPNSLLDLWSQMFLLDEGKRLGETYGGFRTRYFRKDEYTDRYDVLLDPDDPNTEPGTRYYEQKIFNKISDICISLKKEDWLELPELITTDHDARLSEAEYAQYKEFEKERVLEIADETLTAVNMGALVNKLLQFANGAVYNESEEEGSYTEVHRVKIDMLGEILEEAHGKPMLVTYQFKHDVERIKKYLKEFKPMHTHDFTPSRMIYDWNNKKIPVLLGHPRSMGHGLNMQFGSNLITRFGLGWSLEENDQVIARIHRHGVEEAVLHKRIVANSTWERKVIERMTTKSKTQNALMTAVKALIKEHQQ